MLNKLIQWNCRGLKANFNELLLLLTGLCPSIICLQETFLKPSDNLSIRGYTMDNHIHQSGDRASGDSSVIVNNSIHQSQIPLNTNLQAVAVKVTLHRLIHVCSIYGTILIQLPYLHASVAAVFFCVLGVAEQWLVLNRVCISQSTVTHATLCVFISAYHRQNSHFSCKC